MSYTWGGDRIIQNTAINNKRFVIGKLHKPIKTDIREWISFSDNNVMKEILQELSAKKSLPTSKNPGDFDKRAMAIWDFVARNIEYVHDSENEHKGDFWLFPPEIYTLRQGDCEDASFLLASLLIASGISPFCVRVALGEMVNEKNKSLGGHCWVTYRSEMGQWCILESTLDIIPPFLPVANKYMDMQFVKYVPFYCFNNYHLWEILPFDNTESKFMDVQTYLLERGDKINIKNTKFPSGGWLSKITADMAPGHLELTGEVLKKEGFSNNVISIVSDASQDPDLYDWYKPCAHAQTDNNSKGETTETPDQAKGNYINWIKDTTNRMVTESEKDVRYGLFFLGYALHGIQDLASHQGITNAQHSYITKEFGKNKDGDHNPANRERAIEYSGKYMEMLKSKHGDTYEKFKNYKGGFSPWGETVSKTDKCKLLNKPEGWDFSPSAYIEYSDLAGKYEKIKDKFPKESTCWQIDAVFEKLLS